MSATTIPAPRASSTTLGHGLRVALVATALVVLLGLSFVAGRTTSSASTTGTKSTPAVTPTTVTPTAASPTTPATTNTSPAGASATARSCHMVPDC